MTDSYAENRMPSATHPNRRPYNRLLYDINDRELIRLQRCFRGTLYDLGCGEAPYRDWFLQHARSYVGVDWSSSAHHLQADIIADLNGPLPIEDGAADSVVSLSVLEHLREPQMMISEAFRILKPGGGIVAQVPFIWGVHEAPHDYFRFTRYGLEHLFATAGFVDIHVTSTTGFWVTSLLRLNYQSRKLLRGPRLYRQLMHAALRVAWISGECLAPLMDKHWKCDSDTAGYWIVGRRPS